MAITYLDPVAEPGVPVEPYEARLAPDRRAPVIALLGHAYPDANLFLDHVETALGDLTPGAEFRRYDKGNASVPCPDALIDRIATECHAMVTAWGH
jgi:hypothetical protein